MDTIVKEKPLKKVVAKLAKDGKWTMKFSAQEGQYWTVADFNRFSRMFKIELRRYQRDVSLRLAKVSEEDRKKVTSGRS